MFGAILPPPQTPEQIAEAQAWQRWREVLKKSGWTIVERYVELQPQSRRESGRD